jgi:uncharacterized iron-regulated membrane protein
LRTYHKIVGAICALQIIAWIVTGLLFNYKFRYDEAYEPLKAAPAATAPGPWVSPADALALASIDPSGMRRVHLLNDNRGSLYLIEVGDGLRLADARSGAAVEPLDAAGADAALRSALSASPNASRYGAVREAQPTSAPSAVVGRETPAWALELDSGQTVTVNAYTAEISHTSALNTFIDWTYAVHYMQYTPWKSVNIGLVIAFSVLLLSLVASGVRLLLFGDRVRSRQMFGGRRLGRGPKLRF